MFNIQEENNIDPYQKYRDTVYPIIFGGLQTIENIGSYTTAPIFQTDTAEEIKYKTKKNARKILDFELAIDIIVRSQSRFESLVTLSTHTIQERILTRDYGNVPIRVTNSNGNPSEFFKWNAANFLVMIIDDSALKKWIWIPNCSGIPNMVRNGSLEYELKSYGKSEFITIPQKELIDKIPGTIIWDSCSGLSIKC